MENEKAHVIPPPPSNPLIRVANSSPRKEKIETVEQSDNNVPSSKQQVTGYHLINMQWCKPPQSHIHKLYALFVRFFSLFIPLWGPTFTVYPPRCLTFYWTRQVIIIR